MVTKFLHIHSGRAVRTHGNHLKNTAKAEKLERSDRKQMRSRLQGMPGTI